MVWLESPQKKFGPIHTNADGPFRLTGLEPDEPVVVWSDGSGVARRDEVHVFPREDYDIGRLTMVDFRPPAPLVEVPSAPTQLPHCDNFLVTI